MLTAYDILNLKYISPAGCAVSRVLFRRHAGKRAGSEDHLSGPAVADELCPKRASGLPAIGLNHAKDRCLALHPVGFTLPADSRRPRCALTAPFHPYPSTSSGRYIFCGTFPISAKPFFKKARTRRWALPTTAVQWCSDFPPPELAHRGERLQGAAFHTSDSPLL